ncbi:hypothetical protein BXQ17_13975 [Polaribacter sp. BM10]|uniref:glycosyltransferase n=1 Tax=Polaribacter sp. BM10 TaxID=1529069 RepID=UPI000989BC0E|nr:glycosyltransferase [Polaribacter sp. BM10]AQS95116.1 hypothetical protein BXQ17_13975 [Polaribacter sp. BM10]
MIHKFTVVMSVYINDTDSNLRESVDSLLNQTLIPSQIIIVVDGVINNELEKSLQFYSNNSLINIFYLPENKGLANALNYGISKARYSIIARMDADDLSFPDRFENQLSYMFHHKLDVVGGQIVEFGNDIKDIIATRNVPLSHNEISEFMKTRSPFSHPTVIFKKDVFDTIGGYDSKIFPEDYDFFVRAYLSNFKLGNFPDNVLWFRIGNNKKEALKRRRGFKYARNEVKLYFKFYKIGFYNLYEFLKVCLLKIPLRIIPFPIFYFLYFKFFRNN